MNLIKDENWLSALDLTKILTGENQKFINILKRNEFNPIFKGNIKRLKSGKRIALCINKSELPLLMQTENLEYKTTLPQKSQDWLSPNELKNVFIGTPRKFRNLLIELQNHQLFKGSIKQLQVGTQKALCIHKTALSLLQKQGNLSYIRNLPKKTKEWLSPNNLSNLFVGTYKTFKITLNRLQKHPMFKGYIKLMQATAQNSLCIHVSKLPLLQKTEALKYTANISVKTPDWLSSIDLDTIFVGGSVKFAKILDKLKENTEFKDLIEFKKSNTNTTLCIHKSVLPLLKEKANLQYRNTNINTLIKNELTKQL